MFKKYGYSQKNKPFWSVGFSIHERYNVVDESLNGLESVATQELVFLLSKKYRVIKSS